METMVNTNHNRPGGPRLVARQGGQISPGDGEEHHRPRDECTGLSSPSRHQCGRVRTRQIADQASMPRESTEAKTARTRKIIAGLKRTYPDAHCELNYTNP